MDQNGLQLLLITWFFTVFALAILIVKTWARFRLIRMTGIEDVVTGVTGVSYFLSSQRLIVLHLNSQPDYCSHRRRPHFEHCKHPA